METKDFVLGFAAGKAQGGGGTTAQRSGIFGSPYIAMTPQTVSKSGIVEIEAPISGEVEETNVISSGILGNDSIGHKVLFVLSGIVSQLAKTIEIDGFTEIVSLNEIRVFWGTLNANTAFRHNCWFLCSAIEIEDDYSAVPVTDFCRNLTGPVNTSYLKAVASFRINAKLPSGYGVFVTTTNYDYSDTSYMPTTWEPTTIAVGKPMIAIRRKDNVGNIRTGFACFLKMDTDEYNQAFMRGGMHGNDYTSGTLRDAPTYAYTYYNFYDTPNWDAWGSFGIAYIKLEKSQT